MIASDVLDDARFVLNDAAKVRWTDAEGLAWLTDAVRTIVSAYPMAAATVGDVTLTANAVVQSIPATGFLFLGMRRNTGTDGTTPGPTVRKVDHDTLVAQAPDWYSMTGVSPVSEYTVDPTGPATEFLVYPRTHATTVQHAEVLYALTPVELATVGTTVVLAAEYKPALVDYVLARFFEKDTEAGSQARAEAHITMFSAFLKTKTGVQAILRPFKAAS